MNKKKKRILLHNKILNHKNTGHFSLWSKIFFGLGAIAIITLTINLFGEVILESIWNYYSKDLPEVNIQTEDYPAITRIYDRTGKLLFEDIGKENRIYIKVEDVSPQFLRAILVAEDQNFFKHSGVDFFANLRALWQNFHYSKVVSGASTITQQLATNFFLSREMNYSRKIKEIILAREIEKKYSKKEILEFYINKIPFGSTIYGIEAASRTFFGKSSQFLTLAESASLAVIPRSPNYFYPFKHPDRVLKKKDELLVLMRKEGVINDTEYKQAIKEKIQFKKQKNEILAPHFSYYVLDNLKKIFSDDALNSGLEVITTLDLNLQEKMDKLLKTTIDRYKRPYKIDDGAIVVIQAKTGDILAMSGSYDFQNKSYGQYNGAISLRQPGSTLKPFLYALTIQDLGWSKLTILEDKPINFNGYRPKNFSGYFSGSASLQRSLVNSLNIPAVWSLDQLGVNKFIDALSSCHLSLDKKAGLSMAIGGASASLLDITSAYTAFANQGKCLQPNYFARVKQNNGKILVANPEISSSQVFSKESIQQINNILKKSLSNFSLTKKLANNLLFKDTGVKTGTSNGPRDLWAIGYNSDIIIGVWLGNHDNSLLRRDVYGLQLAVPLWADAMKITSQTKLSQIVSLSQE